MTTPQARDLRFGGRWTPAQRVKNDVLFAAATSALAAARAMPLPWRARVGALLAMTAWLWPPLRRRANENATLALGEAGPTGLSAGRAMGHLAAQLVEGLRAHPQPLLTLPDASRHALESALSAGRGVVYATAHLGPWEAMGPLLVAEGFPIVTVVRESYDPRFDALYRALRDDRGVGTIARGAPGAPKAILRALRDNKVVGFPMDLVGRGVRTVDVPWFGAPTPTPIGPAEIALRTGARVVVGTPGPGGALVIREIATDGLSSETLTAALAAELAARIRAMPESFPWIARRF